MSSHSKTLQENKKQSQTTKQASLEIHVRVGMVRKKNCTWQRNFGDWQLKLSRLKMKTLNETITTLMLDFLPSDPKVHVP